MHHIVAPGFVDRPRRSDCTAGQMDGEAGWWTTIWNIGLPPLARVMGVGRQQQQCDLASTLCKYDYRKGDLFVQSCAMVRRVRPSSISSELVMCGGGVRSILLWPLVARCLETIDVCI